ncbi:hypothetical protein CXG81DRAFT_1970, partial [Caulochytrium protostelioides]
LAPGFMAHYELNEILGEGISSFVSASTRRRDGMTTATKFLFKERILVSSWVRDRVLGTVPRELSILRRLKHPNIIEFLDCYEDEWYIYLVMENHGSHWSCPPDAAAAAASATSEGLAATASDAPTLPSLLDANDAASADADAELGSSRDLFECIETMHVRFTEHDVRFIFRQIAHAVAYLHARGFVHQDVKEENVVVNAQFHVKLIDFGVAAPIPETRDDWFDTFHGTTLYAAPEILRGDEWRGPEQDVWASGILLYTLVFGRRPFSE